MKSKQRYHFFIGKGGVGKSTLSALTGVYFALNRKKTAIVSLDPAHNQQDIFEIGFSEKPKKIAERLFAKEINLDFRIKKYLKGVQDHFRKTYNYHDAFNLKNYYKILKFSPGMESQALISAFNEIIAELDDFDILIFDMPPTALSMSFFSLPFSTLVWLKELLKLRTEINRKKEIISRVKLGKVQIETDKITSTLTKKIEEFEKLTFLFRSSRIAINLISNQDKLSLHESKKIISLLEDLGMRISSLIINKSSVSEKNIENISGYKAIDFPLLQTEISAYENLRKIALEHQDFFENLLKPEN